MNFKLTPKDLKKFASKIKKELESVFPFFIAEISLKEFEEKIDIIKLNISYKGRHLGYLKLSLRDKNTIVPDNITDTLAAVLNLCLDKAVIYKQFIFDQSGLYSRNYFNNYFVKILKCYNQPKVIQPLKISKSIDKPELILVIFELQNKSFDLKTQLKHINELIGSFKLLKGVKLKARFSYKRLVLLIENNSLDFKKELSYLLKQLNIAVKVAWVSHLDIVGDNNKDITQQIESNNFLEKVFIALSFIKNSKQKIAVQSFKDIIKFSGKITQLLPLDRAIINLGSDVGALAGQIFAVEASSKHKGEAIIFETHNNYSIVELKGSVNLISQNDSLILYDEQNNYSLNTETLSENFISGRNRVEEFLSVNGSKKWAMVIFRLDGYEKIRLMFGAQELNKKLLSMEEIINKILTPNNLLTRWNSGSLTLLCPQTDKNILMEQVQACLNLFKDPVSVGIALSDSLVIENLLELPLAAEKALAESILEGQNKLAFFGALALNISGDKLFEKNDLEGAIAEYKKGLLLEPNHINLLNSLGVCQGHLGDYSAAINNFNHLISLENNNMMAHYNLGYTYILDGQLEEAKKAFTKAAELEPNNFDVLYHLGETSLRLGYLKEALNYLKKAEKIKNRPNKVIYKTLGEALFLSGHNYEALKAFKKAAKINPSDGYVLSNLGALFLELNNDLEVARSLFQKSVELDPSNSLHRQRLGLLLFRQGEFKEAERHLQAAVEYGGKSPEIYCRLGLLAKSQGRLNEAPEHFKAALELDPDYEPALKQLEK